MGLTDPVLPSVEGTPEQQYWARRRLRTERRREVRAEMEASLAAFEAAVPDDEEGEGDD